MILNVQRPLLVQLFFHESMSAIGETGNEEKHLEKPPIIQPMKEQSASDLNLLRSNTGGEHIRFTVGELHVVQE